MKEQQSLTNSPKSSLSMSNGGNFYFDVRGLQLRVWFSSFTGAERIYLDDELVSSNRSYRKMSTHTFQVDGEAYALKVGVRSWGDAFRGIYVAELYRGEQLIDQDEIILFAEEQKGEKPKQSTWRWITSLLIGLVVGYGVGYTFAKLTKYFFFG
ncbi:MAG: hypothetical protein LAT77_11885 [Aliidiomarina sp.]|uniref:hypothetical protein n=1 Tax=Aliidiomarina sp. TaxID=1872439 RepID=UPI0025BD650C|nr:hypothetical protein [Aliidiomarina sp.]MCH8502596.1 hypothetical protein [Aliidiomarina sp.]